MSAEQTRSKILDAMFSLIAEQGYERASIGRIAEIVEVKKAAIYYYYKKKEDILFDLMDSYIKEYSFDCTFYETSNYDEYKEYFINLGQKIITDYRGNIPLRRVVAEISLLAQRNEQVQKKVLFHNESFENALEKFFKHGINIKVLSENFDVKLNTNLTLLIIGGIGNSVAFNQNIEIEEAWPEFVNRLI